MTFDRINKNQKTRGSKDKSASYNKNVNTLELKKFDRMKTCKVVTNKMAVKYDGLGPVQVCEELECWFCGIVINEQLLCTSCRNEITSIN